MKALITGVCGFIGSHLAAHLLSKGWEVAGIDDLSTGRVENVTLSLGHPKFKLAIDTVSNELVMDRLVSECDVIFHLAAAVGVKLIVDDPIRTIETNIDGTQAVLRAAKRYRKKVLIASTSEVYGKSGNLPFHEDDDSVFGPTTRPRWSYAVSKSIDEFLGLAYYRQLGLPVVIFRLFNTVGPRQTGQYGMVVPRFVKQALSNLPLTVYGDGTHSRCFCNVSDVVQALDLLATKDSAVGQVFNIGSTEEVTIRRLAEMVLNQVCGKQLDAAGSTASLYEARIQYVSYEEAYGKDFEDMKRRVPDISKIFDLTGWKPQVSLQETLRGILSTEE